MEQKDFNARVSNMCKFIKKVELEPLYAQLRPFVLNYGIQGVFIYASSCERFFEKLTRVDYKRRTTFSSDLSIAEWCLPSEPTALADTFCKILHEWKDNVEFMGELIIALNIKSWEHHSRCNSHWSQMYAVLYNEARTLYFDWFDKTNKKHDEAMTFYYDNID